MKVLQFRLELFEQAFQMGIVMKSYKYESLLIIISFESLEKIEILFQNWLVFKKLMLHCCRFSR